MTVAQIHGLVAVIALLLDLWSTQLVVGAAEGQCGLKTEVGTHYLGKYSCTGKIGQIYPWPKLTALGILTNPRIDFSLESYIKVKPLHLKWKVNVPESKKPENTAQDIRYLIAGKSEPLEKIDWLDIVCLGPKEDDFEKLKKMTFKMICHSQDFKEVEEKEVKLLHWPEGNMTDALFYPKRALFSGQRCKENKADAIVVTKDRPVRLIAMAVEFFPLYGGIIMGVDMGPEMRARIREAIRTQEPLVGDNPPNEY